jgi:hypothetical protein
LCRRRLEEEATVASEDPSMNWKRRADLDAYAAELIDLHAATCVLEEKLEAGTLQPGETATVNDSVVTHSGVGLMWHKASLAIDLDSLDSKSTLMLTTMEHRSFARHMIEATTERRNVIGVGDPGIGKTRGASFFAIQELLNAGKTVMRVGFKESEVVLFKKSETSGAYEVWTSKDVLTWTKSNFAGDCEVFAVIDPPEAMIPYVDMALCRTLKFASNNAMVHYRNANKDKIVLVCAPPTEDDVIVSRPLLWCDQLTPFLGEQCDTEAKKDACVSKHMLITSRRWRGTFNHEDVKVRANSIIQCAKAEVTSTGTLETLVNTLVFDAASEVAASSSMCGRLFSIAPRCGLPVETWKERRNCVASVNPLARAAMHSFVVAKLKATQAAFSEEHSASAFGAAFEADVVSFVLSVLPLDWKKGELFDLERCRTVVKSGRDPKFAVSRDETDTAKKISETDRSMLELAKLREEDNTVLYMQPSTYPAVDFALSRTRWYNAKGAAANKFKVKASALITVLKGIGVVEVRDGKLATVKGQEEFQSTLTMVHLCNSPSPSTEVVYDDSDKELAALQEKLIKNHVDLNHFLCAEDALAGATNQVRDIAKHYGLLEV